MQEAAPTHQNGVRCQERFFVKQLCDLNWEIILAYRDLRGDAVGLLAGGKVVPIRDILLYIGEFPSWAKAVPAVLRSIQKNSTVLSNT
eukprot:5794925-Amphidinium_carterae.1